MTLSLEQAQRNERWNALEVLLAAPYLVLVTQYVPVLVTRLGASALLVGFLVWGSAAMLVVGSLLGAWWLQRVPDFQRALGVPVALSRGAVLALPIILLLPIAFKAEAIVALAIAIQLAGGLLGVSLTAFLPRMTLPERLAHLVSLRWTMLGVGMALGTLGLAPLLELLPLPINYVVVCVLALLVSGVLGGWAILRIEPQPLTDPAARTSPLQRTRAAAGWASLWKHRAAREYLWLSLLMHTAVNAPVPLIPLLFVRQLNATDLDYGVYLVVFWASLAASGPLVPRLMQPLGGHRLLALACLGLGVQSMLMAVATSLPWMWAAGLVGGVASVMLQVSGYDLVVRCAPVGHYEDFVSVHAAVVNIAIIAGPLLSSALVQAGTSLPLALLLSAVLRVVSGVFVQWRLGAQ
ncbi:MAG: MFS transporter [Thermoflexales bacterium]|nr:MFS transporter [Thermoflexales bacterium]